MWRSQCCDRTPKGNQMLFGLALWRAGIYINLRRKKKKMKRKLGEDGCGATGGATSAPAYCKVPCIKAKAEEGVSPGERPET